MENLIAPEAVAVFFARVLLGILFMFQGYDKIFSMGIKTVVQSIQVQLQKTNLPYFIIYSTVIFTSFVEFIGGMLLIIGLFKYYALYFLGFDLLIASLFLSIANPLWKMDFVLPRFILLIFVIMIPCDFDFFTLDKVLFQ